MRKRLSSIELYDKLVNSGIYETTGEIRFSLAGVDIRVCQKDVVGNIIQEWLRGWMDMHEIVYASGSNTQLPPDYYLDPSDITHNLIEVKAFNYNATPGFDISDFKAYQREVLKRPELLLADYLIFGYSMDDNGDVVIKKIWLKKVWEISRSMANWPLNLQVKQNVVYNIRPSVWYSDRANKFKYFECLEDFLSALEETVYKNPDTRLYASSWRDSLIEAYEKQYSVRLEIPRWYEIKDKYQAK